MQVGCGVYELRIRDRPYLYFWHYETRGGSRVQLKEYIGPTGSPRVRAEAIRRCEAYFAGAVEDLERMRVGSLAGIRAMGGT